MGIAAKGRRKIELAGGLGRFAGAQGGFSADRQLVDTRWPFFL